MRSISFPVAALAGIALYVGLYHLIVHFRRPDSSRRDLYFALTAVVLSVYDVFSIGLYESRDIVRGGDFQRLQIVTIGLAAVPFMRFIESYTGVRLPRFARAATWVFPIAALIGFFGPRAWIVTDAPSIKRVVVPFLGEVVYYERVVGPFGSLITLAAPFVGVAVAWSAYRAFKTGHRTRARWFAIGATIFVAGLVNDALVALDAFRSMYLIEYAWTGVVLLMSVSLSEEIVQAAFARQELLESRGRLAHAERLESVGKLAGGVAHDLNNMLTPVLSYAELARRKTGPESKEREYLGHVISATERAAALTRQLLAFGRKQVLEVGPVDLHEAVRELSPLLVRLLPESISLRTHVDPDVPAVIADRAQLEQVFMNLVANARDAMPSGGEVAITVSTESQAKSRQVRIEVRDSGSGMDEDTARRIFEPFFTTKPRGKGTGLGLSIVHGIISQHGGTIHVESAKGFGTKFVLLLPASEARPSTAPPPPKLRVVSAHGGERVLVVDDDPIVRHLVEEVLLELGFRVRAASSAEEVRGLLATSTTPFDLLVTDVVLDDASGPEIRAIVEGNQGLIRCLFMSGHAEEVLAPKGVLEAGVTLLRKPFTPDDLAAHVRLVLARESVRPGASTRTIHAQRRSTP